MTHFENEYFQKFKFTHTQISRYLQSALRDLKIAREDPFPEVRFSYAYQALIKTGIALLAKKGHVKVRSVPGHHVKILSTMSELLQDEDILVMGNAMRMKRNDDLYGGSEPITEKEAGDYLEFVGKIIENAKKIL